MLGELYWAVLCCAVLCLSDPGFIAAMYYPALRLQWYVRTYWMDGRVDLLEILSCLHF